MVRLFARGLNFLFGKSLRHKNTVVTSSLDYLDRKRSIDKNYFDYIRLSSVELASYEINKKELEGNVAELGVYKGKFAKYLNEYFPKRSLYLFDTFEGFDNRDINSEKKQNFSSGAQDFSDTSVESVLQKMPFPEKCIPRKGFFPESAKGIEDRFVFVSIDTDLYEPVYNGLQFFYPRLAEGGYIFIHDFNNDHYKGARTAVEQYCREEHIGFVPIADLGGTAIIAK